MAESQPQGLRRHLRGAILVLAALLLVLLVTRPWSGDEPAPSARPQSTFDPPDVVPADSEYVRSRVLGSGEVRVDHWIRSTSTISGLILRLPETGQVQTPHPKVTDVRVETDSGREAGPRAVRSRPVTFTFHSTPTLHVSYRLSGVVARSTSAPGRALVQLTSLDLSFTNDRVPKTVMLGGGRLLAAACSAEGSTAEPRPCGNAEGNQWRVRLETRARHDRVTAQVDLPQAQAAATDSDGP